MSLPAGLSRTYAFIVETVYDAVPASVRSRVPEPLKRLAKYVLGTRTVVEPLTRQLWGGFSATAYPQLVAIANDPESTNRSRALVTLALWHGAFGDADKAAELLDVQASVDPEAAATPRYLLPRIQYLCLLGRGEEARDVLRRVGSEPVGDSLALAWASTYSPTAAGAAADPGRALAWINRVFDAHGLARIARRDAALPLTLDNLVGVNVRPPSHEAGLVSVIVPAYNAADTIETALRSLAEQSWRNLEVVIVDDASTDDTADVAERFCATDARFRVMRRSVNAGSYTCRNAALAELRGDYITTLDGDDWAHPQRIARHVADLEKHNAAFNVSNWVRATDDLLFSGASRPAPVTPLRNMGSFFMRRSVMEKLGGWHEVRIAADTEYMKRAELLFRTPTRGPIVDGAPLVLGRLVDTSLTRSSATSLATLFHGVRREYHELVDFFHARYAGGKLSPDELRTWPVRGAPPTIRPARGHLVADVLLVGDWNTDKDFQQGKRLAGALHQAGKRVAFFNYPRHSREMRNRLDHRLREYVWSNGMSFVAAGETAEIGSVVIVTPDAFEHVLDRFPTLTFDELLVLAPATEPTDTVRQNIAVLLGRDGRWTSEKDVLGALS